MQIGRTISGNTIVHGEGPVTGIQFSDIGREEEDTEMLSPEWRSALTRGPALTRVWLQTKDDPVPVFIGEGLVDRKPGFNSTLLGELSRHPESEATPKPPALLNVLGWSIRPDVATRLHALREALRAWEWLPAIALGWWMAGWLPETIRTLSTRL